MMPKRNIAKMKLAEILTKANELLYHMLALTEVYLI